MRCRQQQWQACRVASYNQLLIRFFLAQTPADKQFQSAPCTSQILNNSFVSTHWIFHCFSPKQSFLFSLPIFYVVLSFPSILVVYTRYFSCNYFVLQLKHIKHAQLHIFICLLSRQIYCLAINVFILRHLYVFFLYS